MGILISSFLLVGILCVYFAVSLKHFISAAIILALSSSFSVQVSLSYSKVECYS